MRWRIGASTGCCVDRPILDVLDAMHEAAIEAVEVGTPPRHFDPWREHEVSALGERLRRHAMLPISIHAPFGGLLDLSDPNPHRREAAIGAILTAAAALTAVGGQQVVVHPSDVPRDGQDVPLRLQLIRESLQLLAGSCGDLHLRLTIETPLPHLIGGQVSEFEQILNGLPAGVGICLDTGHTSLGHQWRSFLDLSRGRLSHVHASDHHGQFDDHLPPGEGILDWPAIGRDLRDAQFDGWIMLELRCPAGSIAAYFARAVARLRALLP